MSIISYDATTFWEDRYSRNFTLGAAGDISMGPGFNQWYYRLLHIAMNRAFKNTGTNIKGAKVMEVAFGVGGEMAYWKHHGAGHVKGFEISKVALEAVRDRYAGLGWQFENADFSRTQLPEADHAYYDVAAAFAFFLMLDSDVAWENALGNLCDAVRPGGHIVFSDGLRPSSSRASYVKMRTIEQYSEVMGAHDCDVVEVRPVAFSLTEPHAHLHLQRLRWRATGKLIRIGRRLGLGESIGFLAGAVYFPFDLLMTSFLKEGSGYHLVVGEKRSIR